jgi:hypothetical protein
MKYKLFSLADDLMRTWQTDKAFAICFYHEDTEEEEDQISEMYKSICQEPAYKIGHMFFFNTEEDRTMFLLQWI